MWILPFVGYMGTIIGFCFLTLSIASGLYYLSELVEEHTVLTKRLLTRLIYIVISINLLLALVDRFPLSLTAVSVFSHVIYLGNMRRFPFVKLFDPLFLSSCVLVFLNHYLWFRHFGARQTRTYENMAHYYNAPSDLPTFTETASFFGLCVWLVPFALFVSLSASDNVLPTVSNDAAKGMEGSSMGLGTMGIVDGPKVRKGQGLAKVLVDNVRSAIGDAMA